MTVGADIEVSIKELRRHLCTPEGAGNHEYDVQLSFACCFPKYS